MHDVMLGEARPMTVMDDPAVAARANALAVSDPEMVEFISTLMAREVNARMFNRTSRLRNPLLPTHPLPPGTH